APTVEKLAAVLLHELEAGSDRCLVRLHGTGPGAPVFLIAGVGGHVFTFNRFARLLGDGRPGYGGKAIGGDGARRPPERVEEIAAEYKREILELGRPGPVTLCGYSVGALTALELARQLQADGHPVGRLVVFDKFAPGYPRKLPLRHRLGIHL